MVKKINGILFMVCVVMVLTAQGKRPDDKAWGHSSAAQPNHAVVRPAPAAHAVAIRPVTARPAHPTFAAQQARRAPTVHNIQVRPQVKVRSIVVPQFYPQTIGPRIYAVAAPAAARNNRLFHRRHHGNWQPRYNFYGNQYHFYPYVNIASTLELSGRGFTVGFDGQNYYYDQGTFYVQDQAGQYMAVPPPLGIIVNPIAPGARLVNVGGQMYYRYKGVFYVQTPQGYQVVGPVLG